jgi:tryptophan-rich sensory protein
MSFWKKVLLCVLVVELLGNISGLVTASAIGSWYEALQRPPGTPPNWLFGPVWLSLYAMIGVALALLWHRPAGTKLKRRALAFFGLQFGLNLLWSPVFFGLQQIELAAAIIVLLLCLIGLTMRLAFPISRTAAGLLLPYFLWVGYATYLNVGFWVLNG